MLEDKEYPDPFRDEPASDTKSIGDSLPNLEPTFGDRCVGWIAFWFSTWIGTTIAGGLFGSLLGLSGVTTDASIPFTAFLFGAAWAGGVGLLIFLHIGFFCWMLWILNHPITVASIAGAVTGMVCGLIIFSLVTAPMGFFGAYLTGKLFLKSKLGQTFSDNLKTAREAADGRLRYTTTDLLLRMTVISVFIAGWTTWYKAYQY